MRHPFHKLIGDIISENIKGEDIEVFKDRACDPSPRGHVLPLYHSIEEDGKSEAKSSRRARILTNVDSLILKENKIKVIIEIEESNVKPIHLFGKFFASALSSYYSHPSEDEGKIGMSNSVLFIQILYTKNLNAEKTQKIYQWENIKKSIENSIKNLKCSIDQYEMYYGDEVDFGISGKRKIELINTIKEFLDLKF